MSRDSASLLDLVRAANLVLQFAQGLEKAELATNIEKQSAILYQYDFADSYIFHSICED